MRWAIKQPATILSRSWDENETLLFHVESGDTHLLGQSAAALLAQLEERNRSLDELSLTWGAKGDRPDPELIGSLKATLAELELAGLIEAVE